MNMTWRNDHEAVDAAFLLAVATSPFSPHDEERTAAEGDPVKVVCDLHKLAILSQTVKSDAPRLTDMKGSSDVDRKLVG